MDGLFNKVFYAPKKKLKLVMHLCVIIILLLTKNFVFSQLIQKEYRAASFLGKADTGIADAKGFNAIFYNPAGIAQGKGTFNEAILASPQFEFNTSFMSVEQTVLGKSNSSILQFLSQNPNTLYSAAIQNYVGIVFKRVALGVFSRSNGSYYNNSTAGVTAFSQIDVSTRYGSHLTFAQPLFNDRIFLGLTGKYIQKSEAKIKVDALSPYYSGSNDTLELLKNANERKGAGIGSDIGVMFLLEKNTGTQLGLTYRNIGMSYKWVEDPNKGAPTAEPTTLDFGFVSSLGTTRNKISFSVDLVDVLNTQKQILLKRSHIGLEYSLLDVFGVQTGINQGYWVYGGYLGSKFIRVEGGVFTEEMGSKYKELPSQSAYVRIVVGWLN